MKKMIICGATGLNNSGDEAILDVLLHQYTPYYDVTVISLNKKNTILYHKNIRCIELKDKTECLKLIKNSDVFLLGGGGLFQDETSILNIFRWFNILNMAIKYSKRTIIYANSIGPLKYKISRYLVKKCMNKVYCITLRDKASMELLKDIGIITPMFVSADPVFNYPSFNSDITAYELPEKYVVFAVRHWYDMLPIVPTRITNKIHYHNPKYDKYILSLNQIVKYINDKLNLPVIFLPFFTERDYTVAKDIISYKKLSEKNIILGNGKYQIMPKDFMSIIRNSEFLVGMRLHSLIYAMNCLVPYIAIDYSTKVRGILQDLDMIQYSIPVDELTLHLFVKKYKMLIRNKKQLLSKMDVHLNDMKLKERTNRMVVTNQLDISKRMEH